jgi:hypothetical protein
MPSPPPFAMPTERPNLLSRDLSAAEKTALAHALSRSLKDPDSAQFQWGPVKYTAAHGQTTEYCGIVNAKNSYGGYTGYQMFHSFIYADAKGQYLTGSLDDVVADNATGDDLADNVKYRGMCIEAGYGGISLTPQ